MSYFIPARGVLHKALIGTFEGQEFQHIYYQYKKLHKMRPFYLAWRQIVSVKKKMITKMILIAVIMVSSMTIATSLIIHYNQNKENAKLINNQISLLNEQIMILNTDNQINKNDFKILDKYTKDILYIDYISYANAMIDSSNFSNVYCITDELETYYHLKNIKEKEIIMTTAAMNSYGKKIKVGDNISLYGKEYRLIQIVENDIEPILFLHQNDFQRETTSISHMVMIDFGNVDNRTRFLIDQPQRYIYFFNAYEQRENFYNDENDIDEYSESIDGFKFYTIIISCAAMIYIYQFSFELSKEREDIGNYQLLGLTHQEIRSIYFYKSIFIAGIGMIFGTLYHFLDVYYKYYELTARDYLFYIPSYIFVIIFGCMIILMIVLLSLIPLHYILKNDAFENKNVRE